MIGDHAMCREATGVEREGQDNAEDDEDDEQGADRGFMVVVAVNKKNFGQD